MDGSNGNFSYGESIYTPSADGAAAGNGIGQGGQSAAVDHAVGIDAVFADGQLAPDQTGLGMGDQHAVFIGELMGFIDLAGDPLGDRIKRHGEDSLFVDIWVSLAQGNGENKGVERTTVRFHTLEERGGMTCAGFSGADARRRDFPAGVAAGDAR